MMFKVVVLALALQVLGVVAVPAGAGPSTVDCTAFLVDQCKKGDENNPQVEVIHNANATDCSWYCNTAYADKCKFFVSDEAQNLCEIWIVKPADYNKGCSKHAGPRGDDKTNVKTCVTNSPFAAAHDCQGVKQGSCMFEGNLLDHLNDITSEDICQQACQHVPGCKYYVFDSSKVNPTSKPPVGGDCELLDSDSRQCDLVMVNKGVTATIKTKPTFECSS